MLVSDQVGGRSRSAVATVRALAMAGYLPMVAVSGRRSSAALSRFCAGVVKVPSPHAPDYRMAVEHELFSRPHLTVFAASDAELLTLHRSGTELIDKAFLPRFAAAAGLRVPVTHSFTSPQELQANAADLDYPLVVKSTVKSQTSDAVARRIESPAALDAIAGKFVGPVVVQRFHTGTMKAAAGVIHAGEILAIVHQSYDRIWPVDCGVACAAITTGPDPELEARLPRLLGGHDGIFQVQLIDDQLIDINPRVYGSLPLAVAAGVNLPAIACGVLQGRVEKLVRGASGVRYRWFEGDLRRVFHDVRAGHLGWAGAACALRPRRRMAHSVESLRDPLPGLTRLVEVAGRRR